MPAIFMHGKTLNALLGYGFDTKLVEKIRRHNYTVAHLRSARRAKLREDFTEEEVETLKIKIDRSPILDDVLDAVVTKSLGCCCYCKNGNSFLPYQIHHIDPYAETQDNSEENLLLVCPIHHVVIHKNGISRDEQRRTRWAWLSIVEIAAEYKKKGLVFPFGAFEPLDFSSPPSPGELIEFAPLSPATSLICHPEALAATSLAVLREAGFLLVLGGSGSGKSTYAMALAGLQTQDGYSVFRYRYDKNSSSAKTELASLISLSVRKTVILLDDANRWATSEDLRWLAKTIAHHPLVRVVATWSSDNSEDVAQLVVSDLPKMELSWEDLKPAVIRVLRRHENEIVPALQRYEEDSSFGSLGFSALHSSLQQRIDSIGDKPQTVYEFIFCLRGDGMAVTGEFNRLFNDGRADLPVLITAIEQIADFERAVSVEEVLEVCRNVPSPSGLPAPTLGWIRTVLDRQIKERKIVSARDHYTTIHRRWAAKFIAAGLSRPQPDPIIEELAGKCFSLSERPTRLLRMWSWLGSVKEARPFVRKWVDSLSESDWTDLVRRCAAEGLMEVGFLAHEMHLLKDDPSWTPTVKAAFTDNESIVTSRVHGTTPNTLYWLKELANPVQHAAPELWTRILLSWDRKSVADLLVGLRANQFEDMWSAFNKAVNLCPGWLTEVGANLPWNDFESILMSAEPGDMESLSETFDVVPVLWTKVRRSQLKAFGSAMTACLRKADLHNLRVPISCFGFVMLIFYFPEEARAALGAIDAQKMGTSLSSAQSRDWEKMAMLALWAEWCHADIVEQMIEYCDQRALLEQIKKGGPSGIYGLRPFLHFIAAGSSKLQGWFIESMKEIVRTACSTKNDEAKSLLATYAKVDPLASSALAMELAIEPEDIKIKVAPDETDKELIAMRKRHREWDALGHDYELEFK